MTKGNLAATAGAVVLNLASAAYISSLVGMLSFGASEAVFWAWLLIETTLFFFCKRRSLRDAILAVFFSLWISAFFVFRTMNGG